MARQAKATARGNRSRAAKSEALARKARARRALRAAGKNTVLRPVVLGGTALMTAVSALAQDSGSEIEEIIVTAMRRSVPLTEVPSNLTVYDGEMLKSRGVETFGDLGRVVPGFAQANFDPGRSGWGGALPILRGMNLNRINDLSPNIAPATISTYYGNTLLPMGFNLADIERIEVLRGPHGTLYGSGSMAGTIQIVPASPDLTRSFARLSAAVSSTRKADDVNYDAEGVFNWAASDTFGARFVVGRNQRAGFIDERRLIALDGPNVPVPGPAFSKPAVPVGDLPTDPETYWTSDDVNDSEMEYLRAKIRVVGGERFSLELTYDLQQYESDSRALDNPRFSGIDEYQGTSRLLNPVERELELGAVDIESDFGFATLSVNASTYRDDAESTGDWTSVGRAYVGFFYYAPYGLAEPPRLQGTSFYFGENDGDVLEARLTSNGDGRFNWIVGGFYTKQDQSFINELFLPGITAYSDAVGNFWPYRPPFFPDAEGVPDDLTWEYIRDTEFKEVSGFVDGSFNITDRWEIATGMRVFRQEFAADAHSLLYSCNFYCSEDFADPRGRHSNSTNEVHEDVVLRLSTNFRFSEQLLGYLNYAEGFRRGGSNAVPTMGILRELPSFLTFDPDKVKSYEVGLRGELGAMSFTANLFYSDWQDPQVEGLTPSGNWYGVFNFDSAEVLGVELEASGDLAENVAYSLGYAYVDAKLAKNFTLPAVRRPLVGVKGDRLPGVPKHSITASIDWRQPGLLGEWDGNLNLNLYYRSNAWNYFPSIGRHVFGGILPSFKVDGFAVVNTSYSLSSEKATVTLFVENLFESRGVGAVQEVTWGGDVLNANYGEYVARPRTIGLRTTWSL